MAARRGATLRSSGDEWMRLAVNSLATSDIVDTHSFCFFVRSGEHGRTRESGLFKEGCGLFPGPGGLP